jgi:hypothetical protein
MFRLISDAKHSFDMSLQICLDIAKSNDEEAKEYFENLLNFIVESYLVLGKKENYKDADLETLVKVYELSKYIKKNFIERVLIHYAQAVGTTEICDVVNFPLCFFR